jgi:uncharacterized protein (TIGR02996 family)
MAAATVWTEEQVRQFASDRMFENAQKLVQGGRYRDVRRSADGAWLAAACQGSEPKPYAVVLDLSDPTRPVGRCTCPYKEFVRTQGEWCKHIVGLLLLFVKSPEQFAVVNVEEAALADPPAQRTQNEAGESQKSLEEAFLKSIREEPTEDSHRLIYADWLEEQGDADSMARAEFIRLQCRLHPDSFGSRRVIELWKANRAQWLRGLPKALGTENCVFQRGFLDHIELTLGDFLRHAAELFARHPLHRLTLWGGRFATADISRFAVCPHLARLIALSLKGTQLGSPSSLKGMLNTPYLSRLVSLDLSSAALTSKGVNVLVTIPFLSNLKELFLSQNKIADPGVEALASCPALSQLTHLDLRGNSVRTKGATALADSPYLRQLACLDLRGARLMGAKGKEALRQRFGDKVLLPAADESEGPVAGKQG